MNFSPLPKVTLILAGLFRADRGIGRFRIPLDTTHFYDNLVVRKNNAGAAIVGTSALHDGEILAMYSLG